MMVVCPSGEQRKCPDRKAGAVRTKLNRTQLAVLVLFASAALLTALTLSALSRVLLLLAASLASATLLAAALTGLLVLLTTLLAGLTLSWICHYLTPVTDILRGNNARLFTFRYLALRRRAASILIFG